MYHSVQKIQYNLSNIIQLNPINMKESYVKLLDSFKIDYDHLIDDPTMKDMTNNPKTNHEGVKQEEIK